MRILLLFITLTCIAAMSGAQVIEQFTKEIKEAFPSNTKLEKVLEKYRSGHGLSFDRISDPVNFFGLTHHYFAISTTDRFEQKIWRYKQISFSEYSKDTVWETLKIPYSEWMLDIYADKDTIIYVAFDNEKKNGRFTYGHTSLYFYKDTLAARRYVNAFNVLMGTSYKPSHCFSEGSFEFCYGTEAGGMMSNGPVLNRTMEHIFKCVISRNIDIIRRFCESASFEAQTYGATGLYLLRKDGYKLNAKDKKTLARLSRSKEWINHYEGGCLIDGIQMSSILKEKNGWLKETHSRFVEYKDKPASKKESTTL